MCPHRLTAWSLTIAFSSTIYLDISPPPSHLCNDHFKQLVMIVFNTLPRVSQESTLPQQTSGAHASDICFI